MQKVGLALGIDAEELTKDKLMDEPGESSSSDSSNDYQTIFVYLVGGSVLFPLGVICCLSSFSQTFVISIILPIS
jgi:hypothetical protein